jgi:hypothetical protein
MPGVSKTPKITSWVHTGPKFCPYPSHAFLSATCDRKQQTRTSDARVQQCEQTATYAAHHRAQLRDNALEPPKTMGWLHRAHENELWMCCAQPTNAPHTTQTTSTPTEPALQSPSAPQNNLRTIIRISASTHPNRPEWCAGCNMKASASFRRTRVACGKSTARQA